MPLIPTGTWIVVDASEEQIPGPWWDRVERSRFAGVSVPFRAGAYAIAWLRWILAIAGVALGGAGVLGLLGALAHDNRVMLMMAVPCIAVAGVAVLVGRVLDLFRVERGSNTLLVVGIVGAVVGFAPFIGSAIPHAGLLAAGGVAGFALLWLSVRATRASHARALELADALGMPRKSVLAHLERCGIQPSAVATTPAVAPDRAPSTNPAIPVAVSPPASPPPPRPGVGPRMLT